MPYLKLKAKVAGLAAESIAIRKIERQTFRSKVISYTDHRGVTKTKRVYSRRNKIIRLELRDHRVNVVRREARAAQIAYGFLRGFAYAEIENTTARSSRNPDWDRVANIAQRFALPNTDLQAQGKALAVWIELAKEIRAERRDPATKPDVTDKAAVPDTAA